MEKSIFKSAMQSRASGRLEEGDGQELDPLPGGKIPDEEAQIEADPASSSQAGVQQQNDSDRRRYSSGITGEETDRLWADLKAEIGYDSYDTYLEANEGKQLYIKSLRQTLRAEANVRYSGYQSCAIFDVHDGESDCPKIDLQYRGHSGTVILSALRHPSATAILRIVLWDTQHLVEEMVDALGLGLRIQPRFFKSLFDRRQRARKFDIKQGRIAPDVIAISRCVMTIARRYLPANQSITPVVLIAGVTGAEWGIKEELGESTAFQTLAMQKMAIPYRPTVWLFPWMQEYIHLLESDLEKGTGSGGDDTDLLFWSLSPIMKLSAFEIYQRCALTREKYVSFLASGNEAKRPEMENIFVTRSELRRLIEDSKDSSQQIRRFLSSQEPNDTCQTTLLTTIEGDLEQARVEASRVETEIRDFLQLQTGELALQESRRSIELANSQIEEAKRGQSKHFGH